MKCSSSKFVLLYVDILCYFTVMYFFFQHGITQANELVNLTEFFVNHILPDLKSNNGEFCEIVSFL